LRYSLNGGPLRNLSIGPDSRRLQEPGDFNVEIDRADLVQGANQVEIVATDSLGETSSTFVTLVYDATTQWPGNYIAEWSLANSISDVAQVVDGQWELSAAGVRPSVLGYDRTFVLGDQFAWTSYEVVVPITVHGIDLS